MSKVILSDRITYPPPVSIRQPSDLQECQKNAQNRGWASQNWPMNDVSLRTLTKEADE